MNRLFAYQVMQIPIYEDSHLVIIELIEFHNVIFVQPRPSM